MQTLLRFPTSAGGSLSDSVYERLLNAILTGEYGWGEDLSEVSLASRLQVSRTPIREALRRLAGEGLVKTLRNRRSCVVYFSRADVIEMFQVRGYLEAGAARLAAERITPKQLRYLRDLAVESEPNPEKDWTEAARRFDLALHYTVALASGNERLQQEIARYNKLVWLVRQKAANPARQALSRAEHLLVLHALQVHDPDSAAAAMSKHIASALKGVLAVLSVK
jgi:DNA-binding GntR family transcriptional regulator